MAVFEFNSENLPTADGLRHLLQQADESYDPLAELLRLERDLAQLEADHGMASATFAERYQAGDLGDTLSYVAWAGKYRLYIDLRESISDSLKMVLTSTN